MEDLVATAKRMGMRAVGLTDHGTFAGAINFIQTCRKAEIKPIMGMEAYMSRKHTCHDKTGQPDGRKGNRHINLIAKNYKGYQNICALSQISSLEGYYYDPRIDFELLQKHSEGVIVTSACLSNVINWNLSIDRFREALQIAGGFKDVFGGDFYLEIMYHGIAKEAKVIPGIIKIANDLGVKVIATNDCHYINKEDAEFHEILMCMSSGRTIRDPKRIKFPYAEFYFKSPEEMAKLFRSAPYALTNTLEIAEKCDYSELIFGGMLLPKFEIENNINPLDHLSNLAWAGLKRLKRDKCEAHVKRLQRELDDLRLVWDTKNYDFSTYLLIIDDIMRYAAKKQIAGGIRGSGFGSMIVYSLGISEGISPIEQDLMWERFLGFDDKNFLSELDFGMRGFVAADMQKDELLATPALAETGSGAGS